MIYTYFFFGNGLIDDVIVIGWTDSDFKISRALCITYGKSHAQTDRWGWLGVAKVLYYVTEASNWYWLKVGEGLLSLQQVRVEGECFYFFCFFTFIHFPFCPVPLFYHLYYFFSLSLRDDKMTHKGWYVIKPQFGRTDRYNYYQIFSD